MSIMLNLVPVLQSYFTDTNNEQGQPSYDLTSVLMCWLLVRLNLLNTQ